MTEGIREMTCSCRLMGMPIARPTDRPRAPPPRDSLRTGHHSVVFACPPVPPAPSPRVDRPHYTLAVHVADDLKEVDGDLTVRFTPNRPTQRLVFRLWPNGPLQRQEGSQLDVGDATSAGHTLPATRPDPTTLVRVE